MLKRLRTLFLTISLLFAAGVAAYVLTTREDYVLGALYERIFGSPDLGPVDFPTLKRGSKPNTALACPPGFCPDATADFDPGVFPVPDEVLRQRFQAFALNQPDTVIVFRQDSPGLPMQDRYVQRSRRMQFPDTIDVRFIALSETTSTLAIYSRSQIGYGDWGVNLARIRLWTSRAALGM